MYLTKEYCSIDKLQLLGASSLLLASKMEEIICPRVRDFAFATDNGFRDTEIIEMEGKISKVLEYNLYPATLNYWANYLIAQWDLFIINNPFRSALLEFEFQSDQPLFKSDNIDHYKRFRSLFQALDLMILDLQTFNFDKRHIVIASFYLQIILSLNFCTRQDLNECPENDIKFIIISVEQENTEFSSIIQNFI